jgi:hypothetical protein
LARPPTHSHRLDERFKRQQGLEGRLGRTPEAFFIKGRESSKNPSLCVSFVGSIQERSPWAAPHVGHGRSHSFGFATEEMDLPTCEKKRGAGILVRSIICGRKWKAY